MCENPTHYHLRKQLDNLSDSEGLLIPFLRKNLEQIYALRLFYADLYAKPVPSNVRPVKHRKKTRVLEHA